MYLESGSVETNISVRRECGVKSVLMVAVTALTLCQIKLAFVREGVSIITNDGAIYTTNNPKTTTSTDNNNNNTSSFDNNKKDDIVIKIPSICFRDPNATQDYRWIGDGSWYPMPGIPAYSPRELIDIFGNKNVLFIGDSTCRQDYRTAVNLMNATDLMDISKEELDTGVGPIENIDDTCVLHRNHSELHSCYGGKDGARSGKFDRIIPMHVKYYSNVEWFVRAYNTTLVADRNYTVLYFSLGTWDVAKQACEENNKQNQERDLHLALELIKSMVMKNPNVTAIWKVPALSTAYNRARRIRCAKNIVNVT
jgi:hypothetical protein